MRLLFLFILAFAFVSQSFAQKNEYRLERPSRLFDPPSCFPIGEHGFIILDDTIEDGHLFYKLDFYDNQFKFVCTKVAMVDSESLIYATADDQDGNLYMVSAGSHICTILKINKAERKLTTTSCTYKGAWDYTDMVIKGQTAIICNEYKTKAVLLDLNKKVVKKLEFKFDRFNKKAISIVNYQIFEDEILVFVNAKTNIAYVDLYMFRLDKAGERKSIDILTSKVDEQIVSISASPQPNGFLFCGSFSHKDTYSSEGIFVAEYVNERVKYMKFHSFLKLENFSSTVLSKKAEAKVAHKVEKKKERGEEYFLKVLATAHQAIPCEGGHLVIYELYRPTYRTQGTGQHQRSVFTGYLYTDFVIVKFDNNGDLIWSNVFDMLSNFKPFTVIHFVDMSIEEDVAVLSYQGYRNIHLRTLDMETGETLDLTTKSFASAALDGDKMRWAAPEVDYWYGDYFIMYGLYSFKNEDTNDKRRVFVVKRLESSSSEE